MAFTTSKVELSAVGEDLLAYLSTRLSGATAWLFAVPLAGREALRIVAGRNVHVPLLFTIEPMTKGVLGTVLTEGKVVRLDASEPGGAWYEVELGGERIGVPIIQGRTTIAAVSAYGPTGSLGMHAETLLMRICEEARPLVAAAVRVSEVEAEIEALRRLLDSVGRFADARDREALLDAVLEAARLVSSSETGSVMLYDPADESLKIACATHLPSEVIRSTAVRLGEGISGWVAQSGAGQVINDADTRRAIASQRPTRSAVCVPMVDESGRLWGVINVGITTASGVFSDVDVGRLSTLASHAARALARLERQGARA